MGTTYYHEADTKKRLIEIIKKEWKLIDTSLIGNQFWAIIENQGKPWLVLFLLSVHNKMWGYKFMDESMHPYYYNCSKRLVKKSTVASENWREMWRAEQNRKKKVKSWRKKPCVVIVTSGEHKGTTFETDIWQAGMPICWELKVRFPTYMLEEVAR